MTPLWAWWVALAVLLYTLGVTGDVLARRRRRREYQARRQGRHEAIQWIRRRYVP